MISLTVAIFQFMIFAIWNRKDWFNAVLKVLFLLTGLALSFQALKELGYIIAI